MNDTILPVIVYAESTPNPATMKFVANRPLVTDRTVEYTDASQAKGSPLATELFRFPFIKGVYIAANFVTITKSPAVDWVEVMNELRDFMKEFLDSGKAVVESYPEPVPHESRASEAAALNPSETEARIIDILDEYIKPAVEQDGGEIAFRSFDNGVVNVVLRGACSGCPSSTLTLKAGIEQLLKRMVPGVESVVAENE